MSGSPPATGLAWAGRAHNPPAQKPERREAEDERLQEPPGRRTLWPDAEREPARVERLGHVDEGRPDTDPPHDHEPRERGQVLRPPCVRVGREAENVGEPEPAPDGDPPPQRRSFDAHAYSPSSRQMMCCWISLVPSQIVPTLASRK